jgi:hypothetical protein
MAREVFPLGKSDGPFSFHRFAQAAVGDLCLVLLTSNLSRIMNVLSDASSSKPVSPWFELFGHQFSSAEIRELKLSAAESGLSVNQWMDRAIRTALRETFPKSSLSSVKSSPHDS